MLTPQSTIKTLIKRDGRVVPFNSQKITDAIFKAAQAVGGKDNILAQELTPYVIEVLEKEFTSKDPTVENVQDAVEKVLIERGHARTAKAFILYRYRKSEERESRP